MDGQSPRSLSPPLSVSKPGQILAILITSTTSTLIFSQDDAILGSVEVFAVPSCRQIGSTAVQSKTYSLPNRVCVNTPPLPGINNRLLSYKLTIPTSVNATACFFDVYPQKNCQGNYAGFQSTPNSEDKCDNVLQGFTGVQETFGGTSVFLSCVIQLST